MAKIIVIDDDLALDLLVEDLGYRGHNAVRIGSAEDALRNIDDVAAADLIVLDVIMSWPTGRKMTELAGSRSAGMEIYKEVKSRRQDVPIIVYSASQDKTIVDAIQDDVKNRFLSKGEYKIKEIVEEIYKMIGVKDGAFLPQVFIVHGRNDAVKLEVKNYLQNTLHLPEPIILHEKPNLGRTIIEKFEEYADRTSIAIVLLTPDDVGSLATDADDLKRRARQNVVFEMGYFIGCYGRSSGRVILLHVGPLELPSDLSGVIYIDISKGVEAAGEQIRKEILNAR